MRAIRSIATIFALASIAWALQFLYGAGFVDDTFIFLRYASNIAEGWGPVFNLGERVEGFSSPLWTAVLALAALFGDGLPLAARWLGCLAAAGCTLVVDSALRREGVGRPIRVLIATAWTTMPAFVFWSGSGMDSVLFCLVSSACLVAGSRIMETATGATALVALLWLCTLTRMEGVIVAGFVIGGLTLRLAIRGSGAALRGAWVARIAAAYGGFVGTMLIARKAYYGDWVPNTFYAKVNGDVAGRWIRGVEYLVDALAAHWPLAVFSVAIIIAAWRWASASRAVIVWHLGWIFCWSAYAASVGGDNFGMYRFVLPAIPSAFICLGCLLQTAWEHLGAGSTRRNRSMLRAGLLGVAIVALAASHIVSIRYGAEGHRKDMALVAPWSTVGRWLHDNTAPDSVIAACMPGAMGYFSHRTMIDMLGLTDAQVARRGEVYVGAAHAHARYNTEYMFERQPDYIVYHSSGRFSTPRYTDPERIARLWGNALYDFVTDPRCAERYEYQVIPLPDGTVLEMQRLREFFRRPQ